MCSTQTALLDLKEILELRVNLVILVLLVYVVLKAPEDLPVSMDKPVYKESVLEDHQDYLDQKEILGLLGTLVFRARQVDTIMI